MDDDDLLDFASGQMFNSNPTTVTSTTTSTSNIKNKNDNIIDNSKNNNNEDYKFIQSSNNSNNSDGLFISPQIKSSTNTNSNSFISPILAQTIDPSPIISNNNNNQINSNDDLYNSFYDDSTDTEESKTQDDSLIIPLQYKFKNDNNNKNNSIINNSSSTQQDDDDSIPLQYLPKDKKLKINNQDIKTNKLNSNNNIDNDDDDENYFDDIIDNKPVNNNNNNNNNNINNNNNKEESKRFLPNWMKRKQPEDQDIFITTKENFEMKKNVKETLLERANSNSKQSEWVLTLTAFKEVEEPILKGRVICFDLETSGFGVDDSIIEIGAVELIDGRRTGIIFQSYAQPKSIIHPKAEEIHQLSNYMLQFSPPIEMVLANFMDWVGDSPLVAHNLAFDRRMLIQELVRSNIAFNHNHICFCTMKYFRKTYAGCNYSLDSVSQKLKINKLLLRKTHGALVDSEILAIIYTHLISLPSNQSTLKILENMKTHT